MMEEDQKPNLDELKVKALEAVSLVKRDLGYIIDGVENGVSLADALRVINVYWNDSSLKDSLINDLSTVDLKRNANLLILGPLPKGNKPLDRSDLIPLKDYIESVKSLVEDRAALGFELSTTDTSANKRVNNLLMALCNFEHLVKVVSSRCGYHDETTRDSVINLLDEDCDLLNIIEELDLNNGDHLTGESPIEQVIESINNLFDVQDDFLCLEDLFKHVQTFRTRLYLLNAFVDTFKEV